MLTIIEVILEQIVAMSQALRTLARQFGSILIMLRLIIVELASAKLSYKIKKEPLKITTKSYS